MSTKKSSGNKRVPYYSPDRKIYPMTQTRYEKKGSKWVPVSQRTEKISYNRTKDVLSNTRMPFEKSHRLTKKDRYIHDHPYDTYTSIRGDGEAKVEYYIDFEAGRKERERLAHKSYADKQRYKAKKAMK